MAAPAAGNLDRVAFCDLQSGGVLWMYLQSLFRGQGQQPGGAPGHRAAAVMLQPAAGREHEGEVGVGLFHGLTGVDGLKGGAAAGEAGFVQSPRATIRPTEAGPHQSLAFEPLVADAGHDRNQSGDFLHDLGGAARRHRIAHAIGQGAE